MTLEENKAIADANADAAWREHWRQTRRRTKLKCYLKTRGLCLQAEIERTREKLEILLDLAAKQGLNNRRV